MQLKFNLFAWYERLASRERRIFQGAVGCVLILFLDMALITPLWDSYVAMDERIAAAERTLLRNLVNLNRREVVEAEYEKYRAYERPAGRDEEENAGLLSEVEQLARSHQVVLVDMKPREGKSGQFHKEYVAELDAEAEMANLIKFIHQMEGSAQLIKVTNAKLVAKEAKSNVVKVRINVAKTAFLGGS